MQKRRYCFDLCQNHGLHARTRPSFGVAKPEYAPVIERLMAISPYDIVSPDTWFNGSSNGRGLVWTMFLAQIENN